MLWTAALPLALAFGAKPRAAAGFGAPKAAPQTLAQVCGGFRNRLPKSFDADCACGSGESYANCCRPYHTGEAAAETPERCLRSRYSAFCYRLVQYIVDTTDKTNVDWKKDKIAWAKKLNKGSMFDGFEFVALGVGELEQGEDEDAAYLSPNTFTLQPKDALSKPPITTVERSKFVRRKSGWKFSSGVVTSDAPGMKGQVLKSERDVAKLEKDVEYVNKVLKQ